MSDLQPPRRIPTLLLETAKPWPKVARAVSLSRRGVMVVAPEGDRPVMSAQEDRMFDPKELLNTLTGVQGAPAGGILQNALAQAKSRLDAAAGGRCQATSGRCPESRGGDGWRGREPSR